MDTPAETDAMLMDRVQAGDDEAFAWLYDRHAARALRVARSVCWSAQAAEDAVQEAFLSIWRSSASYRPEKGSFRGWSMRVVRNRAIDASRREMATHRPPTSKLDDRLADPAPPVHDAVIARSEGDAMRNALQRIPEAQAEVIALAFYGELSHSEIARQLDLPSGTVKGRMRLGLQKLRQRMEALV